MNSATLTTAIRGFGSAKEIARVVGCSEATAARYRRGETMPDPMGLARLMGRSRTIARAMLQLAGLDDLSMEVEEARLRHELHRLQQQRAERANADVDVAIRVAAHDLVGRHG
jgi:transcriptional regulator with XRE-family HTH domain